MKLAIMSAAIVTIPILTGCMTSSEDQVRRTEAWSRCRTAPNPEIRDRCIETEIALMEAKELKRTEASVPDTSDAEPAQSPQTPQEASPEVARQKENSGLIPQD